MKKFLLTAIAAFLVAGAATAQERGRWAVGPQVGLYTNTGTNAIFGFGAVSRYSFTDHWRIQPALTFLCKKNCSIDISGDMQYLFRITRFWSLCPQAGLSFNDLGDWSLGVDLGVGTDFTIASRWDVSAGFKWMIQTRDNRSNPLIVNLGATYRF